MKKILVPTDFSANSRAGVRFAIHWATRQKLELVFVNVLHIFKVTSWPDAYFEKYKANEEKSCRARLEQFINDIYGQMNVKPGKHSFLILDGMSADISLLDYCRKNKDIDYICISTRGTGKLKKIFGTNTGNLITRSDVPVLAVPKNYKIRELTGIMYAADLRNYKDEIKRVLDFAKPLKTNVEVVHFSWPDEILFDEKTIEATFKRQFRYGLKLHIEKNDGIHSLVENLETQIRKRKPSVVIMFTNQERTFFQKLFLSSKTEEMSFRLKTPLLVFNKNGVRKA